MTKSGTIAFLGLPNAGKSSFFNSCVGTKMAAVGRKPNLTIQGVQGVKTFKDAQFLFMDNPGFPLRITFLENVDILCYLINATVGWTEEDRRWMEWVEKNKRPESKLLVFLSQIDRVPGYEVPVLPKFSESYEKIEPLSCKRKENISLFFEKLYCMIPNGAWISHSASSQEQLIQEHLREALFRSLGQEVPYGCKTRVVHLKEDEKVIHIKTEIYPSKQSHKQMIIGKGGEKIRCISQHTRLSLEVLFQKKVFLTTEVKLGRNIQ